MDTVAAMIISIAAMHPAGPQATQPSLQAQAASAPTAIVATVAGSPAIAVPAKLQVR